LALTPELYEAIVRIVDQRVGEIKVTREDFDRLTKTLSELSDTVKQLAEAQRRTEERVQALAEAQKRTDEGVRDLSESVRDLAKAVGGLSDTVGYGLEDVAKVMLPPWLEKHERVRIDALERRFIRVNGESLEANLYGEGLKARVPIIVIGEAKSRIHPGDVKEFAVNVQKIRKGLKGRRILPLMFGYWIHPATTSLGKQLGIRLVASYER
jgi:seryl-tRNA synthetase